MAVKGWPNKTIVNSLIATLQREVKPEKLYDAIRKISADFDLVYGTLFDGPLPAVDGFALTRLDVDSLEGIVARANLPEEIAYEDEENLFIQPQAITTNLGDFLTLAYGDLISDPTVPPTSYWHFGARQDAQFYEGQNATWNGSGYDRDDVALGALSVERQAGLWSLTWYDVSIADFRDTFLMEGREFKCANFLDTGHIGIAGVDEYNIVRFGNDAAIVAGLAYGHIAIPTRITGDLPAAAANSSTAGILVIDKTLNRLCFYHGTTRYYLTGTAF